VSGLLDALDGSDPGHYGVAPVAGTFGYDGNPARAVSVVSAAPSVSYLGVAIVAAIDVVLDRAMTPYPAQYVVTCQGLGLAGGGALSPSPASAQIYGLLRQIQPQDGATAYPTRDLANPQSASGIQGSTIGVDTSAFSTGVGGGLITLGAFVVDSSGDYAADSGVTALLKRIYRRAMTIPGSFAHLPPDYGVGLANQVKQLGTSAVRNRLAARLQSQIALEPEVSRCRVYVYSDPVTPSIVRFSCYVKTKQGVSRGLQMPFNTISGQALPPVLGGASLQAVPG
jgi:hypothetical protein